MEKLKILLTNFIGKLKAPGAILLIINLDFIDKMILLVLTCIIALFWNHLRKRKLNSRAKIALMFKKNGYTSVKINDKDEIELSSYRTKIIIRQKI